MFLILYNFMNRFIANKGKTDYDCQEEDFIDLLEEAFNKIEKEK